MNKELEKLKNHLSSFEYCFKANNTNLDNKSIKRIKNISKR